MILYYILFLIILYLFVVAYIKIKYRAWTYQPVFQYFNIFYWLNDDFIIRPQKAPYHRYCNFLDIKTKDLNELGREKLEEFVAFIQATYFKNKLSEYRPTLFSLLSSLEGSNNVLLSLYYKPKMLLDLKSGKPVFTDEIVGSILSKPCIINFKNKQHHAFYADLLCVNSAYRNKDVAAELIQTHEYERSHNTNNYTFFLVKRETKLSYIVPLVLYDVYEYTIDNIFHNIRSREKYNYSSLVFSKYSTIRINKNNLQLMLEYIEEIKENYPCIILPDLGNLYNMVNNYILIIYAVIRDHKIYGVYVYKKSDLIFHDVTTDPPTKKYSIDLIASLYTCEPDIFLAGFNESLIKVTKTAKKRGLHYLLIENISANNVILDDLKDKKIRYNFDSVCAYYLYNYAKRPYFHYKTFIIM